MSDAAARVCPSGEALLELRLALNSSRQFSLSNAASQPLLAVTIPSNGTVVERYDRFGEQVDETDGVLDVSLCLPASGCYGLEDYTGTLFADQFSGENEDDSDSRVRWKGKDLRGSRRTSFPYFLRTEENDFGREWTMFFTEFGSGCSLACGSDEALNEVLTWAGDNRAGGDAYSWRIEDAVGQELVGCGEGNDRRAATPAEGCGTTRPYEVRVTRACLPAKSCARFVFGNPNLILPEGSFVSGGKGITVLGAYNPRFVVVVDGHVVADSTRLFGNDGAVTNANFHAVEIGRNCPRCLGRRVLLEVFAYRPVRWQAPPYSISLTAPTGTGATQHQVVPTSSRSMQYARQCVPQSGCFKIQVAIPESAVRLNRSYYESIPAVVKLDSVYVLNRDVTFGIYGSSYVHSHSVNMGAGCTTDSTCAAGESLVTVKIDTSLAPVDTPPGFGSFVLYNTSTSPLGSSTPPDTVRSFYRGYPAGSHFQHHACVQDAAHKSFGMFSSVPLDVTWSVERDGEPLTCQLASDHDTFHEFIFATNLDGSCGSGGSAELSAGAIAGIVIGSVVGVVLVVALMLFGWRSVPKRASNAAGRASERQTPRKAQENQSLLAEESAAAGSATNEAHASAVVIV
jgi:hypothetical protein